MRLGFILAALLCAIPVQAATITATNCQASNVQSAINSASSGDTVAIPSGSCTWSQQVTVSSKAITLQGAGVGNTVLTLAIKKALVWTVIASGTTRVTGIEWRITATGGNSDDTAITFQGDTANFIMDHVRCVQNADTPCWGWYSYIRGVVSDWECIQNVFAICLYVKHYSWANVGNNGDNSWSTDSTFGTAQALYFETGTCTNNIGSWTFCFDGWGGERIVVRKNTFNNALVGCHGLETSGRPRSCRNWEIYSNTFNQTSFFFVSPTSARGGTGFVHHNTVNASGGGGFNLMFDMQSFRGDPDSDRGVYVWAHCTTKHVTSQTRSGTTLTLVTSEPVAGVWHSGSYITILSGTWAGDYFAVGTNGDNGNTFTIQVPNSGPTSGGATTFRSKWDGNTDSNGYPCMDQVGRGKGLYVSGETPNDGGAGVLPYQDSAQQLEPVYIFSNRKNGSQFDGAPINGSPAIIHENRDYYNENVGFTGSQGVGVGTLVERPASCTTNVGYWATDQGEWDSTHGGNDGQFYQCVSTNSWSQTYKPYTYPHPLLGSGGGGTDSSPNIQVSTPNSNGFSEQTSNSFTLSGSASDDNGVTAVDVSTNGGAYTSATGTTSWTKGFTLATGATTFSARATDTIGQTSTASHQAYYKANPASATDDFADDWSFSEGPQWTHIGNGSKYTRSGSALVNSAFTFDLAKWIATSPANNDMCASGTIGSLGANQTGYAEVVVRASGTTNGDMNAYGLGTDGGSGTGHTALFKYLNGARSEVAAIATTFAAGNGMKVCVSGLTLQAFKDTGSGFVQVGSDTPTGGEISTGTWGVGFIGTASLRDFAGTNVSGDVTAPVVTITAPNSGNPATVTTSPLTTLAGTCTDAVGPTSVTWSNSSGGSGTATGTTSWTVASISLVTGAQTITVDCFDAAGNHGTTDTQVITFTPLPLFRIRR